MKLSGAGQAVKIRWVIQEAMISGKKIWSHSTGEDRKKLDLNVETRNIKAKMCRSSRVHSVLYERRRRAG